MPKKQLLAFAAVAILTSSLAARHLPPGLAASGSAFDDPTISKMEISPTSLANGLAILKVKGHDFRYAELSATCPKKVWLKLGSTNLCGKVRRMEDDDLEHVLLRLRNPNRATGTIAVTVKIVDPEMPAGSAAGQKTVNLSLVAR